MDVSNCSLHGAKLGLGRGIIRIGNVYKRLKTGRVEKCHNFVVDWRVAGRSRISRDKGMVG